MCNIQKIKASDYFQQNYSNFLQEFTELSKYGVDERGGIIDEEDAIEESLDVQTLHSLVKNSKKAYNFDKIKELYIQDAKRLCSVDALFFLGKKLYLIEFKSGFADKINAESYKYTFFEEDSICKSTQSICEQLKAENIVNFNHCFNLRKKIKQNLTLNLIVKLYNSLQVLKKIFKDNNIDDDIEFYYWIIVDNPLLKNRFYTIKGLNEDGTPHFYANSMTIQSKLEKYRVGEFSFLKDLKVIGKDLFNTEISQIM